MNVNSQPPPPPFTTPLLTADSLEKTPPQQDRGLLTMPWIMYFRRLSDLGFTADTSFAVFVFGRGTDGKHASIGVGDITNSKPATRDGTADTWYAYIDVAPTGSSLIADITLNGVSVFGTDGTITGTTTANAATSIVGIGSAFLTQLSVGDQIALSSAATTYATITAIADDTHLTVGAALGNGTSQTILSRYSRVVIPAGTSTVLQGNFRTQTITQETTLFQATILQVGSTIPGKSLTVEVL